MENTAAVETMTVSMAQSIVDAITSGIRAGGDPEDWDAPEFAEARRLTGVAGCVWEFDNWSHTRDCIEVHKALGGVAVTNNTPTLEMIQYDNGEVRVIDRDRMIASDFLWSGETGSRMEDYELDFDIEASDLEAHHVIVRDCNGYNAKNWRTVPDSGRKLSPECNEDITADFYGVDRFETAGVHPSERMSESEHFATTAEITKRARQLLAVWTDQSGIEIRSEGSSEYVYRDAE